eukprot:TRINITY_DN27667_c0_g1_i1.p1 TRINITY_DN27667_c0_g1~~TRINITY_DN27667_c0_g1_i1.p1  ORF type:complete len:1068 (+),score=169.16 TRINITY_DN27667_c0_g1_i1:79-3282(+)
MASATSEDEALVQDALWVEDSFYLVLDALLFATECCLYGFLMLFCLWSLVQGLRPGLAFNLLPRSNSYVKLGYLKQRHLLLGLRRWWSGMMWWGAVFCVPFFFQTGSVRDFFWDVEAALNSTLDLFPPHVEAMVGDGFLNWSEHGSSGGKSSNSEGFEVNIPQGFLDLWTAELPYPFALTAVDLRMFMQKALRFSRGDLRKVKSGGLVGIVEYQVGEDVRVKWSPKLAHCGFERRSYFPHLAWGGIHFPGVINATKPSKSLSSFAYTVEVFSGDHLVLPGNATSCLANVTTAHVERIHHPVWFLSPREDKLLRRYGLNLRRSDADDEEEAEHVELAQLQKRARRSVVLLGSTRFASLSAYSFHFDSYWSSRRRYSSQLWQLYSSVGLAEAYQPLDFAMRLFCKGGEEDEDSCDATTGGCSTGWPAEWSVFGGLLDDASNRGGSSPQVLRCSRDIAAKNMFLLREEYPSLVTLLVDYRGLVVFWYLTVYSYTVISWALRSFAVLLFILFPIGVVATGLLRHVETPTLSCGEQLALVMHTGLIALVLVELQDLCWDLFILNGGDRDGLLGEFIMKKAWAKWVIPLWTLWHSYIVMQLRAALSRAGHAERVQRSAAAAAAAGAAGQSSDAARAASDLGDDPDAEPLCRICMGGVEAGRLISPCLCKGSMRFVHLECLNEWRHSSKNSKSFYQCDQCHYRYGFQRTTLAMFVRSALVLHVCTFAAFIVAVLLCSYLTLLLDDFFLGNDLSRQLTDVINSVLDVDPLSPKSLKELDSDSKQLLEETVNATRSAFTSLTEAASWGSLSLAHMLSGLSLVGIAGFLSMGLAGFPLCYGRFNGRHGDALPFFIIIVIGVFRVIFGLYDVFKDGSARLLQSAENMILEVGEALPARPAPAGDASEQTPPIDVQAGDHINPATVPGGPHADDLPDPAADALPVAEEAEAASGGRLGDIPDDAQLTGMDVFTQEAEALSAARCSGSAAEDIQNLSSSSDAPFTGSARLAEEELAENVQPVPDAADAEALQHGSNQTASDACRDLQEHVAAAAKHDLGGQLHATTPSGSEGEDGGSMDD